LSLWLAVEQPMYCGFKHICGDKTEHENGVITGSATNKQTNTIYNVDVGL